MSNEIDLFDVFCINGIKYPLITDPNQKAIIDKMVALLREQDLEQIILTQDNPYFNIIFPDTNESVIEIKTTLAEDLSRNILIATNNFCKNNIIVNII